jgi:hypothetical protein
MSRLQTFSLSIDMSVILIIHHLSLDFILFCFHLKIHFCERVTDASSPRHSRLLSLGFPAAVPFSTFIFRLPSYISLYHPYTNRLYRVSLCGAD